MLSGKFFVETLGCAKNVADSDGICAILERTGMRSTHDAEDADVIVVNTCGFLKSSKAESLRTLRALGETKRNGQLLIASGCLISRYGDAVKAEAPSVDGVIEAGKWPAMPRLIEWLQRPNRNSGDWFDEAYLDLPLSQLNARSVTDVFPRRAGGPSAFLKIADGCDRPCTFCIIPAIKGMHRSKRPDEVIAEARLLTSLGARELVLVAQDTTAYGWDWGEKDALSSLLVRLCREVAGLSWLRLMYAYPGHLTGQLIDTMARLPQVVHYIDIPLQHAHPAVLQRMKRPNLVVTQRLLDDLRRAMPDITIRTTFIVGFPGETEEEFGFLTDFMSAQQFDRVGVFEYSREEGTSAARLADQVRPRLKAERRHRAMQIQQQISLAKNRSLVGKTIQVLVEGSAELRTAASRRKQSVTEHVTVGRSYRDAPEVDGMVIVRGDLAVGRIENVDIVEGSEYDLVAVTASSRALEHFPREAAPQPSSAGHPLALPTRA